MLIEEYDVELSEPECLPEARGAIYAAKARIANDVSQVMPYLNAVLERPDYSGDYQFILWRDRERAYALRPHELALSSVADQREAREVLGRTVAMINDVWERRDEITPDHERKTRPQALAVFKLLPGTNCGECGFATCMAFAVELAKGDRSPGDCPYLLEPDNEATLARLKELGL